MKIDPIPSNSIPEDTDLLFPVAEEMVAGLGKLEKTIGVVQNTAAVVTLDLNAAIAAQNKYAELKDKTGEVLSIAFRELTGQVDSAIDLSKSVLRVHLGKFWSEQWGEAGLLDRSLQSPKTIGARVKLLGSLVTYFQNNPDHESKKPEVKSTTLAKLLASYLAASDAVKAHPANRKAAKDHRDQAVRRLRQRLRATISEMVLLLPSDSPEWGAFGLTPPARIGRRRKKAAAVTPEGDAAPSSTRSTKPASGSNGHGANDGGEEKVILSH